MAKGLWSSFGVQAQIARVWDVRFSNLVISFGVLCFGGLPCGSLGRVKVHVWSYRVFIHIVFGASTVQLQEHFRCQIAHLLTIRVPSPSPSPPPGLPPHRNPVVFMSCGGLYWLIHPVNYFQGQGTYEVGF